MKVLTRIVEAIKVINSLPVSNWSHETIVDLNEMKRAEIAKEIRLGLQWYDLVDIDRIQAIKLCRTQTQKRLLASKNAVDALRGKENDLEQE